MQSEEICFDGWVLGVHSLLEASRLTPVHLAGPAVDRSHRPAAESLLRDFPPAEPTAEPARGVVEICFPPLNHSPKNQKFGPDLILPLAELEANRAIA